MGDAQRIFLGVDYFLVASELMSQCRLVTRLITDTKWCMVLSISHEFVKNELGPCVVLFCVAFSEHPPQLSKYGVPSQFDYDGENRLEILCNDQVSKT